MKFKSYHVSKEIPPYQCLQGGFKTKMKWQASSPPKWKFKWRGASMKVPFHLLTTNLLCSFLNLNLDDPVLFWMLNLIVNVPYRYKWIENEWKYIFCFVFRNLDALFFYAEVDNHISLWRNYTMKCIIFCNISIGLFDCKHLNLSEF